MTEHPAPAPGPTDPSPEHDPHVDTRAELLPEERTVGSADPAEQAEQVLADSAERTEQPEAAPTTFVEHRTSEQATDPPD